MPIYCYKCEDCSFLYESLQLSDEEPPVCPVCSSNNIARDFSNQQIAFRPDWPSGFNTSIGQLYSGRRDLMTKMRQSQHYPSGHGGSVFSPAKTFYGDEQYHDGYLNRYDKSKDIDINSLMTVAEE